MYDFRLALTTMVHSLVHHGTTFFRLLVCFVWGIVSLQISSNESTNSVFFSLTLLLSSIQMFTVLSICLKSDQSAWSNFHRGYGLNSLNLYRVFTSRITG